MPVPPDDNPTPAKPHQTDHRAQGDAAPDSASGFSLNTGPLGSGLPSADPPPSGPVSANAEQADRWRAPRTLPTRPVRILVAEDEHLVAADLVFTLSDLGYTVIGPATDGLRAIELAHHTLPDMLLLDIQMPKRDGLAVAEQLYRELAIPSLLLSAHSDNAHLEAANRAGVFGYLVKPAAQQQLKVAIEVAWRCYFEHMARIVDTEDLRKRLDERRLVEQAKWMLVSTAGMTEPNALRGLQHAAREDRVPLSLVAQEVILGKRTIKAIGQSDS